MTPIEKSAYNITSDEDELRVDELCRELLQDFHQELLRNGIPPLKAGAMAHSADYYLRDYLVSARRRNLFQEEIGTVRAFAATWYIISTLEPTIEELARHVDGVREFYRYLYSAGLLSGEYLAQIEQECDDITWYGKRIESFWNISGDGYLAWERECPLKDG
ncbi:MAG: hypothetical protein WCA04_08715 [Geobacteraceae bacterium]